MAYVKVSASVPEHVADAARSAGGDNVSTWVTQALRDRLVRDAIRALQLEGYRGLPEDVRVAVEQDRDQLEVCAA